MQENVTLTFEWNDGIKREYALIGMFTDDVFQYMVLAPLNQEDADIVILPYEEGADGEAEFRDFYSDEEYERAKKAFEAFAKDYMEE